MDGMLCASFNHSCMCHICATEFLDFNFNEAVIDKNINFSRNCPKFETFIKIAIYFYNIWNDIDQIVLPYRCCAAEHI